MHSRAVKGLFLRRSQLSPSSAAAGMSARDSAAAPRRISQVRDDTSPLKLATSFLLLLSFLSLSLSFLLSLHTFHCTCGGKAGGWEAAAVGQSHLLHNIPSSPSTLRRGASSSARVINAGFGERRGEGMVEVCAAEGYTLMELARLAVLWRRERPNSIQITQLFI